MKTSAETQTDQGEGSENAAEAPSQAASIPLSDDPRLLLRIPFEPGDAILSYDSEIALKALAATLVGNPAAIPEVHAYWYTDSEDPSQAKLFALKRGTVIRSFLKEHGAAVPRIRLQAVDIPAPDLVDLLRPQR